MLMAHCVAAVLTSELIREVREWSDKLLDKLPGSPPGLVPSTDLYVRLWITTGRPVHLEGRGG